MGEGREWGWGWGVKDQERDQQQCLAEEIRNEIPDFEFRSGAHPLEG